MVNLSQKEKYITLLLIALYFFTRLINLTDIPIFVDEGGYIFWAKQVFLNKQFYISLLDGKPPLNVWGISALLNFFPNNPLLAGRILSVSIGFLALVGFFFLNYLLFNKRTAFISSLMYIFVPFTLFYDRLAIVDSQVNAVFIWMLAYGVLLARTTNLKHALLLGLVIGLGLLTKGNVWLFVYMLAFLPLITQRRKIWTLYSYLLLSIGAGYLMYFFVLLPYPRALELINSKSKDFLYTSSELLSRSIIATVISIWQRINALLHMTGWISIVYAICGLATLFFRKKKNLSIYLLLYLLVPLLVITFAVKHFFPRYMIFSATLMALLAGYFISSIKNTKISLLIGTILLSFYIALDYPMLFSYQELNFPYTERRQYIEDISSGYGINEIVTYARQKSKKKPVILLSEGIFGVGSNMIDATISVREKNIQSIGSWPLTREVLLSYQQLIPEKYVFVVLNYRDMSKVPKDWPIEHIKTYRDSYPYPHFSLYLLAK